MPFLIRCTQRLLAQTPNRLVELAAVGESWHANLMYIDRRKCALFTHDATLYSVFIPGLKKLEFERLDEVFSQRLFKVLQWDGFAPAQIEHILDACRTIRFARSNSRSVLGSMNDLCYQIAVNIAHDGGLMNADLRDLHHRLNRTPMGAVGYRYAIDGFKERLGRA